MTSGLRDVSIHVHYKEVATLLLLLLLVSVFLTRASDDSDITSVPTKRHV